MNDERRYRQFLQRDRAYDGKFLTGVLTTGIYCLPSCPARRPKRENVRFFNTPDEARRSGLRPCHRCRPDWFYRGEEWYENLFEQTVARVRETPASFSGIASIARVAGISRTALNDLFREHAQESPGAFLRRIRVERVCHELERGVSTSAAAVAAGFESNSAFHQQFVSRTGLTPGAYADLATAREFRLRLPSGYRTSEVLDFYGRDPLSVSERVSASGLQKAILIDGQPALIEILFEGECATVRVDGPHSFAAHRAAVRMLGIDSDVGAFERQCKNDTLLFGLIHRQRGLRIPLTPEPWEALAWAIMGQQISLKAAVALRRELIANVGTQHSSGLYAHPAAHIVASLGVEALQQLKFSRPKAEYLVEAARAVSNGTVSLCTLRNLSTRHAARMLGNIRGIGPWTIQYAFLRGFGFPDCLPAGDAGLAQGLERLLGERPKPSRIRELMDAFAPYRSFATYHVWTSLKQVRAGDHVMKSGYEEENNAA
jgi:AraC family transcriptional regulator, regulatory protein of adaptative response / DNA-3-methyladenine glycosylase II